MASKLTIIAGFLHSLLVLFYLFIGFRLSSLYSDINIAKPNPVLRNWPLLMYAVFVVLDFLYFMYLKKKEKQQVKLNYGWIISLILLIAPFLIFFLVGVYADFQVSKVINQSY